MNTVDHNDSENRDERSRRLDFSGPEPEPEFFGQFDDEFGSDEELAADLRDAARMSGAGDSEDEAYWIAEIFSANLAEDERLSFQNEFPIGPNSMGIEARKLAGRFYSHFLADPGTVPNSELLNLDELKALRTALTNYRRSVREGLAGELLAEIEIQIQGLTPSEDLRPSEIFLRSLKTNMLNSIEQVFSSTYRQREIMELHEITTSVESSEASASLIKYASKLIRSLRSGFEDFDTQRPGWTNPVMRFLGQAIEWRDWAIEQKLADVEAAEHLVRRAKVAYGEENMNDDPEWQDATKKIYELFFTSGVFFISDLPDEVELRKRRDQK